MKAKEIVDQVASAVGEDPDALSDLGLIQIVNFLALRIVEGWTWTFWPTLTLTEERAYRDAFDVSATYGLADEVFDGTDTYYRSLAAGNKGNALADDTKWEAIEDLDPVVAIAQTGKTAIGTVEGAYGSEAAARSGRGQLRFTVQEDGVRLLEWDGAPLVWLKFRTVPAAPKVDTLANVDVPDFLAGFLVQATAADVLHFKQEKTGGDKAEEKAYTALEHAETTQMGQQGQFQTAMVK